ncbi:hypothetical protein JZ751_002485 [Albula glossodonta]|uniref:Major facilitator superfamily (MFS) profile domain-containing protein n=1 Tax=Albula glossodonta TaxID=121402 RepID=A0A8T2NEM3_9TELE|nr:hypothetical protein JZ751_002485 [Albula glossodonta]
MPALKERLREIFTVEPVLFFFMTGTFILAPATQQLTITKVCEELYDNASICAHPEDHKGDAEIQTKASYIMLVYTAALSVVSIPPAMFLGSWSDRVGRKCGMVVPSLMSLFAGGGLIAIAAVKGASAYWTVATAVVTGISGGYVSVFLSCFSYVADVTDASCRTRRMALAESMIFIGGMVGFLLSGVLLHRFGFVQTFGSYCVCHALSILYVLLWLRSPKPRDQNLTLEGEEEEEEEASRTCVRMSLLKYAQLSFKAVIRERPDKENMKLNLLILSTFVNNVISVGEQSVLLLYLTYKPREFTTELYGVFNSIRMLLLGITLMGIFPLLLRFIRETTLAKLSALTRVASYVLLAFSTNTWMVFLSAVVGALSGITQAVVRSLSSAIVGPNEQGAMFSFMASMEALCILVAVTLFNGIYPLTLSSFPGMVFIVMAGFSFIILIIIQWISILPPTQPRLVIQDEPTPPESHNRNSCN